MKNKPTILLLLFFTCLGFAQSEQLNPNYPVPYAIFKTTEDTISIADVSKLKFQDSSVFPKTHHDDIYWVQIDFSECTDLLNGRNWALQIGYMHKSEVFYQTENGIQSKNIGSFQLNNKFTGRFPFTKNNLIDGRYLYLKFSFLTVRASLNTRFITSFPETMMDYRKGHVSKSKNTSNIYSSLLMGGALMGSIIALMFFRTYRRKEYIFYIVYVLCLAFYLSRGAFDWYGSVVGVYSKTNFFLNIILELVANIFYLLFVRHFLDTQKRYPLLNKVITCAIYTIMGFLFLEILSVVAAEYSWHHILLNIRAIFLSALVLFGMIYLIVNRKTDLNWYIVAGSFLYGLGSMLLFSLYTPTYLKMCILAEITVFLFGIGYKIRMENQEKMQLQETSIQNYRKLLRTQINPHFIFNSLNSIQHLITKNERVSAIKYLNKFSKLMRQTLESSIENTLLLSEEITFLNTYLELESFRFDGSFQYQINVDENLCPNNNEMPQLMIQPFVENAILHGLLNKKEGEKILTISFKKKDRFLECTIDDNGIGRKASEALKRFDKNKTSRGMEVTQKRINALLSEKIDQDLLSITDKTDAHGNPTGTTVVLHIPVPQ